MYVVIVKYQGNGGNSGSRYSSCMFSWHFRWLRLLKRRKFANDVNLRLELWSRLGLEMALVKFLYVEIVVARKIYWDKLGNGNVIHPSDHSNEMTAHHANVRFSVCM